MNRKLRNTILAFSVTGMVLAVGLMAAHPVLPGQPAPAPQASAATPAAPLASLAGIGGAGTAVLLADADAVSARIHARSRQYEAALVDADSVEQAIALTVGFIATVVTESVLVQPVDPVDADEAGTAAADEQAPPSQRRGRSVRSAIAVPYFSFARGTGRGRS